MWTHAGGQLAFTMVANNRRMRTQLCACFSESWFWKLEKYLPVWALSKVGVENLGAVTDTECLYVYVITYVINYLQIQCVTLSFGDTFTRNSLRNMGRVTWMKSRRRTRNKASISNYSLSVSQWQTSGRRRLGILVKMRPQYSWGFLSSVSKRELMLTVMMMKAMTVGTIHSTNVS